MEMCEEYCCWLYKRESDEWTRLSPKSHGFRRFSSENVSVVFTYTSTSHFRNNNNNKYLYSAFL